MKKIFLLLLLACNIIACNETDDNNFIPERINSSFSEKSTLTITEKEDSYLKYGVKETGTNLVFEYLFSTATDKRIADGGYSEIIKFEIAPTLNEFSYTDNELLATKIVFSKSCFCAFPDNASKNVVPIGTLVGKKISDNEWEITIDIIFYGDEKQKISRKFTLK